MEFLHAIGWGYVLSGFVVGTLVLGYLPGIFLGSALAQRVPDATLRIILACVLVLVGAKLLF